MSLRATQIETLRAVQQSDGERATPPAVGGLVNCSKDAAKARLDRLCRSGHVHLYAYAPLLGWIYRLTDLGKSTLSTQQQPHKTTWPPQGEGET